MTQQHAPTIDMTISGEFRDPPGRYPSLAVIALRVAAFGLMLGFAAIVFWLAVFTLPLLFVFGVAAYLYVRFQMARGKFAGGPSVLRVFRF
jgi:hypothetical protein